MLRLVLAVLLLFPALASGQARSDWQSLSALQKGDRVKISMKSRAPVEGGFEAWDPGQITVSGGAIKREDVKKVERYKKGVWSRGKKALVGAAIGGGAGAGIGAAAAGSCKPGTFAPCFSRGSVAAAFGGVAAVLGAAVGALLPHHSTELIYAAR